MSNRKVFILTVHRLKLDFVLPQQALVPADPVQQVPLCETTPPPPRLRGRHALQVMLGTVGARETTVALHLALLAEHTCEDAL